MLQRKKLLRKVTNNEKDPHYFEIALRCLRGGGLCLEHVLHGDETTLQVLKESGKTATSKSYMWLYRTSGCAENPIVLYEYQPSRKVAHAEEFLNGFSGWLHADGYQGYHKLPGNIRVVGC